MVAARRPTTVLAMAPAHLPRLLDDQQRARLSQIADVDLGVVIDDFSTPAAKAALRSAEVLFTCWGCPPVDEQVLASAPRLRAIVHAAGSVKGIVTEACWERGLRVSSAAAANAVPVAEYTVAMIVLAGKRAFDIQATYRAQAARRDWAAEYPNYGNYRRTVGIVGASRVGRRVIELLRSYDVDILLSDPTVDQAEAQALGVRLVELDDLVAASDVVSIHAPNIPETFHLVDRRRLRLMRAGALVDTDALVEELASGRINAILDVTDPEPLPPEHPLFTLPNVVVTPHIAGSLGNEVARMGKLAVSELERYARGEEFAHPVLREQLSILA
jgi:phosphoglycerate dehydrogenase-like enzyme